MVLNYSQLKTYILNPAAQRLLNIIETKKTNLALSADLTNSQDLLDLIAQVGSQVCLVKTHIDILADFHSDFIQKLQLLSKQLNFMIFEDRKFADIGTTVQQQYQGGIYKIADWADFITAHIFPGPEMIASLQKIGVPKKRGVFLLAQMSSKNNLLGLTYQQQALGIAKQYSGFVAGFIAQERFDPHQHLLYLTPGVHLNNIKDNLDQTYRHPRDIMQNRQADIMIVGRNIYQATNPILTAKKLRQLGWEGYQTSLKK